MATFSQIIDEMIQETKRPDLLSEICAYLNQTVMEIHYQPSSGNIILYRANRHEIQITATGDTKVVWDIPNPATFIGVEAVRYPCILDAAGDPVFPREVNPGIAMNRELYKYMRSGDSYVFSGYGGVGSLIDVCYQARPGRLKYLPLAQRPAVFDDMDGWQYADSVVTEEEQEIARAATANWILLRYHDLVTEGVRSKVYKRLSDTERARTSYSLYMSLRQGLFTAESVGRGV